MKQLSQVTIEDAKKILNLEYSLFFTTGRWKLTDESDGVGEPCKKLWCKTKDYVFWFFDDCIDIELEDDQINFDIHNFDVKVRCYVEAFRLGYKIYQFDLLNKTL